MQQQITIRLVLFSGLKNGKKLKLPIKWHMVLFYTYAHFMVFWVTISKCNLWTTCKIKQISIFWLKIHFKWFFNISIKIYTSLNPDINDEIFDWLLFIPGPQHLRHNTLVGIIQSNTFSSYDNIGPILK